MKTFNSRRRFLENVLGGVAAAKVLPLLPHAAFAAGANPKRLLCVFSPMGYLESSFWPTGEGAGFTLGETQKALDPYKSKLLYVNGLMHAAHNVADRRADRPGVVWDNEHGNGMGTLFTGSMKDLAGKYAMAESIDQTVANFLYESAGTPYKSIALATAGGSPGAHSSCFYSGSGKPVTPVARPQLAFDTYFANVRSGGAPGAAPDPSLLRKKLLNQSLIDTVRGELQAVCKKLGARERDLCDSHLEGISMLEKRLSASSMQGTPAQCVKPSAPAAGATYDNQRDFRLQADLVAAAFACDLTRVATLQLGDADGVDLGADMPDHHATTHAMGDNPTPQTELNHKKIDAWFASQWAHLLKALSSVPEGDGTMLDNTLVLFGSDTTTGQTFERGAHKGFRFPIWTAGGGNFAFRTGRQVMLTAMPPNTPATASNAWGYSVKNAGYLYHNALLVSVAQVFGLGISAYGTYDQGKGGVPGLT